MIRVSLLLLILISSCTVNSLAQSKRRSPPRKSAVVIFQRTESGNREGSHYLKLNGSVKSFHWGSWTRFYNFDKPNSHGREWVEGAEWRIVYSDMPAFERGIHDYFLWSATFTGHTVSSNSSNPSSNEDWNTFWDTFRSAMRKRDRLALRAMMPNNFEWTFMAYYRGERRDAFFRSLDENRGSGWRALNALIVRGAVVGKDSTSQKPVRISPPPNNDPYVEECRASFEFKNGRWWWTSFLRCPDGWTEGH